MTTTQAPRAQTRTLPRDGARYEWAWYAVEREMRFDAAHRDPADAPDGERSAS